MTTDGKGRRMPSPHLATRPCISNIHRSNITTFHAPHDGVVDPPANTYYERPRKVPTLTAPTFDPPVLKGGFLSRGANITTTDVSPDVNHGETDKFCIGPSTELLWWYQRRDKLAINRGPWETSEGLLNAVGQRELIWLQNFGERRFPRELFYRECYGRQKVDPQVQIHNLLEYLKVARYIVPEEESNHPTIRHPDLSPNNVFISESGDITSVIDWQYSTILPVFLQANVPEHFQNYGDDYLENFRPPKLPEGFDSLTESEKEKEAELYRRRQLHYLYLGFTNRNNKPHIHPMGTYDLVVRNRLYDTASRPWEGDHTSLKAELVHASTYWPDIATSMMKQDEFPAKYSEAEVTECLDIDAKQKNVDAQMQRLRDFIGVNVDGWVPTELYDEVKEKEHYIKHQMLKQRMRRGS